MRDLFGTLNTSRTGLNATQANINVTSHNIANARTPGYSRQRVNLQTTRPYAMPSFNSMAGPGQFGTGVEVASVTRIRSHFLDYQVRDETAQKGMYDERFEILSKIEGIMQEPSDRGLTKLMGDFFKAWQDVSNKPGDSNARTVLAQKTDALAGALNKFGIDLEKLKTDTNESTKQTTVEINSLLDQIDAVNQQIIQVSVTGQIPNDLMDKRDLLLDELSQKMNIDVNRDQMFNGENVSPGDTTGIEDPALIKSIFQDEVKRFSYVSDINKLPDGTYEVTYYKHGDMTSDTNASSIIVEMTDEQARELSNTRVLWATKDGTALKNGSYPIKDGDTVKFDELNMFKPSSGALQGQMSIQKDLDVYLDQMNDVAKAIAMAVNAIHSGSSTAAGDDMPFFVNGDVARYDENGILINKDEVLAAEKDITAKNLKINREILEDVMKINAGKDENSGTGEGTRALAIGQLMDTLLMIQNINPNTTREQFVGILEENENGIPVIKSNKSGIKLEGFYKDVVNKLGVQTQEAKRVVANQTALLNDFVNQRLQVSGVSMDEEMTNLIQFQHAYGANAKVISTVDELLDVLINGLKR